VDAAYCSLLITADVPTKKKTVTSTPYLHCFLWSWTSVSVKPSTAISSDLVAAVIMRPFGAAVHMGKRTVNFRLVGLMVVGSVPMALLGAYLLHLMGHSAKSQTDIEKYLGAALLIGAAAMVLRLYLDRRSGQIRDAAIHDIKTRPVLTIGIGMLGGLIVGMTSVGSGSLMIVLLLFAYPMLGANQLSGPT
jgi:uncharacterized protein